MTYTTEVRDYDGNKPGDPWFNPIGAQARHLASLGLDVQYDTRYGCFVDVERLRRGATVSVDSPRPAATNARIRDASRAEVHAAVEQVSSR